MYFESSLDGFIFVHKKQKVHSVDAKKTIVKKVKNIVHLILTFKIIYHLHNTYGKEMKDMLYLNLGRALLFAEIL